MRPLHRSFLKGTWHGQVSVALHSLKGLDLPVGLAPSCCYGGLENGQIGEMVKGKFFDTYDVMLSVLLHIQKR